MSNSTVESELRTTSVTNRTKIRNTKAYDVIIIGAGLADLIAVRELSCHGQRSTKPELERLQESERGITCDLSLTPKPYADVSLQRLDELPPAKEVLFMINTLFCFENMHYDD
ncbi:unnamed protein product [Rotaria magnacalcarata]|uniref:Uncharacterized protein n=1 Tax=Rotaria magnacalcarata TaxID=392030 RepID=A0A819Z783_9BILA|nr:unnamed protein product [Rotaria magnacalcarata]